MNIRVDLNTFITNGTEVVFRSPVDCSQVTGLIIYYKDGGNTLSKEFAFADAHGNNVGDIDHLFAENVAVKVILDVTTSMAFVQNADTNAYLEGRFDGIIDQLCPNFTESGAVVACEPVEGYPLNVTAEDDATKIIRCGKNLFGGGAFESKLLEWGGTKNESDDSVTIGGANVRDKIIFDNFKENTQYTFFFDMKAKSDGVSLNLRIEYSDGTSYTFYKNNSSQRQTHIYVSTKGKTVLRVVGAHYTQVTIYCNTCGIFEGEVAIENFEAYQGGTFAPGEKIPALPGVNTLWADTGNITVEGKTDPRAVIQDLYDKINALSATMTALTGV